MQHANLDGIGAQIIDHTMHLLRDKIGGYLMNTLDACCVLRAEHNRRPRYS